MSCCSRYYNGIIPQLQNMQLTSYLYTWKNASFNVPRTVKTYGQMYSFSYLNVQKHLTELMTSSLKVILSSPDTLFQSSFADYLSAFCLLNIGVTQGSVFSPLFPLFLLPRSHHFNPWDFCIHYKLWPPTLIFISDLLCEVCTWMSNCPHYISFVKSRSPQI